MEQETISVRGKTFHCEQCNVKIVSEKAVSDHIQGRKHQRLTAIRTTRQKQAECSVFVGGLTKLVSELELTDYFSKYGSIAQVIVDKDKGKYAIVEFSQSDYAEKAAEEEKQKMNGKKITVRPRENKPLTLRSKQHASAGRLAKTARDKEMDAMLDTLLESDDVCCQLSSLVNETCLSQPDLQLRYLICDLLQEVFVEVFPKCRVFPYGSTVSGFGVAGCDLDLQIDLGRDERPFRYQFVSMPLGEDMEEDSTNEQVVTMAGQSSGCVDTPNTSQLTHDEILQMLCRLLKQCVPSCQHVRVIPSARRPVVKFIHKESGLHCDLSLDNRLALRNTELLHFYSSLDARVRPLVFAVRQWARYHQLAGNPLGPGPRLTNYALTLLVLHYLQNTTPPVLPTLLHLRELSEPCQDGIINGWDCTFTTDASKFSTSENSEDVETLMKGFFSFYTKVDLSTSVLCPVSGSIVPLTQFLQDVSQMTPADTPREFKAASINIQDPLELSHNPAMNVNDKVAGRFREELRTASLTCISLRYRRQREDSETGKVPRWGFLSLVESRDGGEGKGKRDGAKSSTPTIVIPMKMSQVSGEALKRFESTEDMKQAWCEEAEHFALRLMEEVLCISCSLDSNDDTMTHMEEESMQEPQQPGAAVTELGMDGAVEGVGHNDDLCDSGLVASNHEEDGDSPEPARKKQRLESSVDGDGGDQDVSMSSSGNTSLSGGDELKSPTLSMSPGMDRDIGEVSRSYHCKASHAVWMGRRKLRRKLQLEKPWGDRPIEELSRERLISQELIKSTPSQSDSQTQFRMEMRRKIALHSTEVRLCFHAVHNEMSMKNFVHFFEEFVAKMLSHLKM